jgi:hypothetical protein
MREKPAVREKAVGEENRMLKRRDAVHTFQQKNKRKKKNNTDKSAGNVKRRPSFAFTRSLHVHHTKIVDHTLACHDLEAEAY